MNSMLSSSSSSFLLLSCSWLLLVFPPCSSMDGYRDCSNRFSCGNIVDVEYPFSGEGRPPDCGHPDLKLSCSNRSLTTIEINNVTYNVLEINQETQNLKISRDDLFDGFCSPKFSIATIGPYDDLFEYAPDSQQVTILYDCLSPSAPFIPPALPPASVHSVSHLSASASHTSTVFINVSSLKPVAARASAPSPVPGRAAAPSPVFVPGRASAPGPVPPIPVPVPASAPSPVPGLASPSAVLDCPSGSTYKSAFITTESQAALPCNWTIRVGILRSYVNGDMGNLSKMEEAMRQGFAVKYKMDTGACRECTESGGSCGYNWTTNQSTCYCAGHNPSPSETKCPPPPTVAREDFWDAICPSRLANTTLDVPLFTFGLGLRNVSLYYGCNFYTVLPELSTPIARDTTLRTSTFMWLQERLGLIRELGVVIAVF